MSSAHCVSVVVGSRLWMGCGREGRQAGREEGEREEWFLCCLCTFPKLLCMLHVWALGF